MKFINKLTKRENTIKTALKNGLLSNPENFIAPKGVVFVKTERGYEFVNQREANKIIKEEEELNREINKEWLFNPLTKRVIKATERNERKVRNIKESISRVVVVKQPSLSKLREALKKYIGKSVQVVYLKNGKIVENHTYNPVPSNFSSWWENITASGQWIVDSNDSIFENQNFDGELYLYELNEVISENNIRQYFREGITNCLLTPVKEWVESVIETGTYRTVKKYKEKLEEVEELLEKYKGGVPDDKVDDICNLLQIDISIDLPFNEPSNIICKSMKRPLKKFKFINTKKDHVENKIVSDDEKEFVSAERLMEIKEDLDKRGEYYCYNLNSKGITRINTLSGCYTLANEYASVVRMFEEETGLVNCKLDDVDDKEVSEFVRLGVHYNATVDFKEVYRGGRLILDVNDYRHIDMEKAYANFKRCSYYEGFLGKVTDFRKTDKIEGVGLYKITDLDFTEANGRFKALNEKMSIYEDNMVYPSCELRLLRDNGVKYRIEGGCWGVKTLDFEFNERMRNGREGGVRYYCKYAGMCNTYNVMNNIRLKGSEEYSEFLASVSNKETKIFYSKESEDIVVVFPKSHSYHLSQITAFIASYQRISTLEQLLDIEYEKIVRVCVDGIYVEKDAKLELKNVFRDDKEGTFNNEESQLGYISNKEGYYEEFAEERENWSKELHLGKGGCGKTHTNLVDRGLVKPLFVAPSWKLAIDKKKNYGVNVSVWARLISDDPEKEKFVKRFSNVLIVDEVSMMTEEMKKRIFEKYNDMKIIMCGDLGYQLPPIDGEEMSEEGFDYIKNDYGESKRSKCKELTELCDLMREMIRKNKKTEEINKKIINIFKKKGRIIGKEKIEYDVRDMILTGTNARKNYFTKMYEDKEKYYVTETNRQYQKGCIVIGEKPNAVCELRHAFTVHSIQGETCEGRLYIDISKMFERRMMYTAISRAKYIDQIKLVDW